MARAAQQLARATACVVRVAGCSFGVPLLVLVGTGYLHVGGEFVSSRSVK